MRAPAAVAAARLAGRPGRALLVVGGVATAITMLVGVLGGSLATQDRTLQRSLAALPSPQRTFRIDSFGLPPGEDYAQTDRQARAALALLTRRPPYAVTAFPTLIVAGELVRLAGIDRLPGLARLVSGRWPRTCTAARCEVVQVGAGGRALLAEPGVRLVRVGIAALPDRGVFGGSLTTGSSVAQPQHPILLLAGGAASFERIPLFQSFYRTYSWIAPLDPDRFHIWQVDGILARESAVQARLAQDGSSFELTGPDAALLSAQQDARVAAQRIVLIGGEISALLLGFAFVSAVGLRRGLANESRRLAARGARRGQIWLAVVVELGGMTLAGAALGLGAGAVSLLVIGKVAGLPVGALTARTLGSPLSLAAVLGLWFAASVVIVGAASSQERRRRGLRLTDAAALGAALAAAIGLASTSTNPAQLSSSTGSRVFFTVLPGLICLAAALLAARLLAPAMRALERAARGLPLALRLATLALARAPARTAATAGFLIVSVGLAFLAASYRATLQGGARDEAAFAVPLDFTLSEGSQLVLPLQAGSLARYDRLAPGVRAYPVLRRTAAVAGAGTSVLSPTVLGIPAGALARLHWRSDYSSLPLARIARRVGADGPAALRGAPIPAAARALELTVRLSGVPVQLQLVTEDRSGGLVTLDLGERPAGTWHLAVRLPRPGALRQLVALEVSQQALDAFGSAHRSAEGQIALVPAGTARLGPLTALTGAGADPPVTDWTRWLPRGGATLAGGAEPRLHYAFDEGQTVLLRARQTTDGRALPVVVSSNVAAAAPPGGTITLDFQDAELPARIVGVASRFPASDDLGQGFVVVDESRFATALDADAPGTATPDELWLSSPPDEAAAVQRALAAQFPSLQLASRRQLQRTLESDPLARGITITLTAAAALGLVLAAIGFWVALASDARDERGELFDLEAQGVRPDTLRQQLRLRALMLLAFGLLGGLVLGLILSRLVVAIIGVSAETSVPDPPLAYQAGWPLELGGLAVLALVALALAELTVRRALAGSTPDRASWSLA